MRVPFKKSITVFLLLIYLTATIFTFSGHEQYANLILYVICYSIVFLTWYFWVHQCIIYTNDFRQNSNRLRHFTICTLLTLAGLVWLSFLIVSNDNSLSSDPSTKHATVMTLLLGCLLYNIFIGAKSLADAESENTSIKSKSVKLQICWFLALFYLPIGMFFIDKKLNSL